MLWQTVLLFGAAFIAGVMNSVAGGGSFVSFPALLLTGVDAKLANATNSVALWLGSAASVGAYRREIQHQRSSVKLLAGVSVIGGLLGAGLLLITPSAVFKQLLPFLMLVATLIFALSPRLNQALRRRNPEQLLTSERRRSSVIALQLVISIYGGFFGGGMGILMLATLALMGMQNIHEMNALKTVLVTLINGIAAVAFAIAKAVLWPQALIMALGAILGGYGGAAIARRVKPQWVRTFVVGLGLIITVYLFFQ